MLSFLQDLQIAQQYSDHISLHYVIRLNVMGFITLLFYFVFMGINIYFPSVLVLTKAMKSMM